MNEYMRVYMLNRYHTRRNAAIQQLGGKCVKCGSIEELQFDHIDSDIKIFELADSFTSLNESDLEIEIEFCQLLCKSCHKEKHKSQALHGTPQRYWRGCRCSQCKSANAAYNLEYRRKTGRR